MNWKKFGGVTLTSVMAINSLLGSGTKGVANQLIR